MGKLYFESLPRSSLVPTRSSLGFVTDLKFDIGTAGDGAAGADDFEERRGSARIVNGQLGNAESRVLLDETDHLTRRGLDHDFLRGFEEKGRGREGSKDREGSDGREGSRKGRKQGRNQGRV